MWSLLFDKFEGFSGSESDYVSIAILLSNYAASKQEAVVRVGVFLNQ